MRDTRINIVKGIIRLVFHIANVVLHKVIERKQQKQEQEEQEESKDSRESEESKEPYPILDDYESRKS